MNDEEKKRNFRKKEREFVNKLPNVKEKSKQFLKIGFEKMMDRDKMDAYFAAIEQNKYDVEAWHALIRLIHTDKIDHFRENVYERLVSVFPTSGKFWKIYIEHEVKKHLLFNSKHPLING